MKIALYAFMFFSGIFISSSCSSNTETKESASFYSSEFYFKKMTDLKLDVTYEAGAEPFVGITEAGLNYWDITLQNLQALFSGRNVTLTVPRTLEEMRLLPAHGRAVWGIQHALSLAILYRDGDSSGSSGRVFIAFVKGHAANFDGTANRNVIGYSVTGSNVILIFKDAVAAAGELPDGLIPMFIEQSTLVHELAHSVGFVNNGVTLQSDHLDPGHGAHCSNPTCVMYYLNEGATDLSSFIDKFKDRENAVMFDDACLNDAKNF